MIFQRFIYRLMVLGTLLLTTQEAVSQRRPDVVTLEKLEEAINPTLAEGADKLRFDKLSISVGTISEDGGIIRGSFLVENNGSKPIVILKATADCGCLKVNFSTKPILVGASAQINFTYNPKGYPGRLSRRILLYTSLSTSRPSAKLTVSGFVEQSSDKSGRFPYAKGAALLKGESVTFVAKGSKQVERILAYNNSARELRIESLMQPLPAGVSFATDPVVVAPHTEFDIVVGYNPSEWQGEAENFRLMLNGVAAAPRNSVIEIKFK